jgi:outer membrane murein-binding lipoprotein Lpp
MKRLITSAALMGMVVLGGCSKQSAEGNNTTADTSLNADAATTEGDNLAVGNGLDAGSTNETGNSDSLSTNNTAG